MNFDLRIPVGLMFAIFGAILTIFGAVTGGSDMYQKSLGININLVWGVVMLLFGVIMLILAFKGKAGE